MLSTHEKSERLSPFKIALIYALIGGGWILFSDRLLGALVTDPAVITRLSIYKGGLYVLITAGILYLLTRRLIRDLQCAKEIVAASERRLSLIYDTVGDILFLLTLEPGEQYRFLTVNKAFLVASGLAEEAVVGRRLQAILPGSAQAIFLANCREAIRDHKTVSWEERALFAAGGFVGEIRVTPIYDGDGKCMNILGAVHDITRRTRAKEMLKKSEALLRETQRITKVGGWEYDIASGKLTWTDEVYRMHEVTSEYDPDQFETNLGFYSPEGRPILKTAFFNAVSKGEPYDLELPFTTAKGTPLWVRTIGKAEVRDGRPVRVFGNILDITEAKTAREKIKQLASGFERKVAERTTKLKESQAALLNLVDDLNRKTDELAAANARLQELDSLKSMFIASMSHELRTPLNSIIGFTGIILMGMSGPISDVQKKQLTMVKGSANHLLSLINDVIDVSKIETGKVELTIETFDLSALAEEVRDSFLIAALEKRLQLELKTDGGVTITSDRRRVKQIMVNLAANAIKFTEAGTVAIRVSDTGKGVEITLRDTGIGLTQADMARLFDAFSRIHIQDRPVVEGTGLGLYLSRRIATLLGGDIRAESVPGKGSEFTLCLPRHYQEERQ
jgi:PAS domain S-box-containing protein